MKTNCTERLKYGSIICFTISQNSFYGNFSLKDQNRGLGGGERAEEIVFETALEGDEIVTQMCLIFTNLNAAVVGRDDTAIF